MRAWTWSWYFSQARDVCVFSSGLRVWDLELSAQSFEAQVALIGESFRVLGFGLDWGSRFKVQGSGKTPDPNLAVQSGACGISESARKGAGFRNITHLMQLPCEPCASLPPPPPPSKQKQIYFT